MTERKILFRAKAEEDKRWVYGDLIHDITGTPKYIAVVDLDSPTSMTKMIPIIPTTNSQYTEHTDVDGVVLYGGDIVQHPEAVGTTMVIDFYKGAWRYDKLFLLHEIPNVKKIGNIFDNPGLVRG